MKLRIQNKIVVTFLFLSLVFQVKAKTDWGAEATVRLRAIIEENRINHVNGNYGENQYVFFTSVDAEKQYLLSTKSGEKIKSELSRLNTELSNFYQTKGHELYIGINGDLLTIDESNEEFKSFREQKNKAIQNAVNDIYRGAGLSNESNNGKNALLIVTPIKEFRVEGNSTILAEKVALHFNVGKFFNSFDFEESLSDAREKLELPRISNPDVIEVTNNSFKVYSTAMADYTGLQLDDDNDQILYDSKFDPLVFANSILDDAVENLTEQESKKRYDKLVDDAVIKLNSKIAEAKSNQYDGQFRHIVNYHNQKFDPDKNLEIIEDKLAYLEEVTKTQFFVLFQPSDLVWKQESPLTAQFARDVRSKSDLGGNSVLITVPYMYLKSSIANDNRKLYAMPGYSSFDGAFNADFTGKKYYDFYKLILSAYKNLEKPYNQFVSIQYGDLTIVDLPPRKSPTSVRGNPFINELALYHDDNRKRRIKDAETLLLMLECEDDDEGWACAQQRATIESLKVESRIKPQLTKLNFKTLLKEKDFDAHRGYYSGFEFYKENSVLPSNFVHVATPSGLDLYPIDYIELVYTTFDLVGIGLMPFNLDWITDAASIGVAAGFDWNDERRGMTIVSNSIALAMPVVPAAAMKKAMQGSKYLIEGNTLIIKNADEADNVAKWMDVSSQDAAKLVDGRAAKTLLDNELLQLLVKQLDDSDKLRMIDDLSSSPAFRDAVNSNVELIYAWSVFRNRRLDDLARSADDLLIVSDYMKRSGKSADDVASEIPSSVGDAKKWLGDRKVEPFLDGNPKVDELAELPEGYSFVVQSDGSKYLRRVDVNDPYTPRLTVDETGKIVRYTKPQRLASNGLLRTRLEKVFGTIPANHQAHHIVPSNVAQNSVLHKEAIRRGLYDVDRVSNGKLLAESAEDFTAISDELPIHFGSHPNYDAAVKGEIQNVLQSNNVNLNQLDQLTDQQITNMLDDIEDLSLGVLEDWRPPKLN